MKINKYNFIALLLVILFTGCSDDDLLAPPPRLNVQCTVMAWNVEMFGAEDAFNKLSREIKKQQVDFLMLSECQADYSDFNGNEQSIMAVTLQTNGWEMNHHSYSTYWNGLGFFSRYPIIDTELVAYGNGPRNIYRVQVMVSNTVRLTFYGAHLKSGTNTSSYYRRVKQAQALANYIRLNHDLQNEYVIILGDMNTMGTNGLNNSDFSADGTMEYLTLQDDADPDNDMWAVNYSLLPDTDTHKWPSLLDHVIISPLAASNYQPGSIRVPETPWNNGTGLYSDHRPVVLTLNL